MTKERESKGDLEASVQDLQASVGVWISIVNPSVGEYNFTGAGSRSGQRMRIGILVNTHLITITALFVYKLIAKSLLVPSSF